jgi:TetR/AcrR family transcriptional regulator
MKQLGYSATTMLADLLEIPAPRRRGRPVKSDIDAAVVIREAALKAFGRAGFQGTSIADIARLAGVAKPLVHYHYASKEVLWEAAVNGAVANLMDELASFRKGLNALPIQDLLRQISRQLVVFASRHPALVHIVIDETAKGGPRAQWIQVHFLLPSYAVAKNLLSGIALMQGPTASPPPVEHIVPIVLGVMNFAFMEAEVIRKAYGVDVYSDVYIERHGDLLFQFIRGLLVKT